MLNAMNTFYADESGAVTVDWVVLTAALVGLGLAVMGVVRGGVSNLTEDINTELGKSHVTSGFDASTGRLKDPAGP